MAYGKRAKARVVGAVGMMLLLSACSDSADAEGRDEVTIALPTSNPNALFMNVVAGQELGYFEEAGLEVEMEYLGSNAAVSAAVESGEAEFGIMNPIFQISQAAEGSEAKYKNFFQYSYLPKWVFVAPEQSDVKSIEDLHNATIAIVGLNSEDESIADMWLSEAGVDIENIDYEVIADGAPMGAALEKAQVDAALVWDSSLGFFDVSDIPYSVLDVPESMTEVGGFSLAAGDEVLEEQPELAVSLGQAVVRTTEFVLDDLEAGAQAYNAMYPGSAAAGADPQDAAKETAILLNHRAQAWVVPEGLKWGEPREEEWQRNFELTQIMLDSSKTSDLTMEQFVDDSLLDDINELE